MSDDCVINQSTVNETDPLFNPFNNFLGDVFSSPGALQAFYITVSIYGGALALPFILNTIRSIVFLFSGSPDAKTHCLEVPIIDRPLQFFSDLFGTLTIWLVKSRVLVLFVCTLFLLLLTCFKKVIFALVTFASVVLFYYVVIQIGLNLGRQAYFIRLMLTDQDVQVGLPESSHQRT